MRDRALRDFRADLRTPLLGNLSSLQSRKQLDEESKLLILVPSELTESPRWNFAQGTYMFEIYESGKEFLSSEVELFVFSSRVSIQNEFDRLHKRLVEENFTHLLTGLESDPGSSGWNWDYFALKARCDWNGMVIGLSTDSVYRLHQLRFNRFISIFKNTCVVGIDIDVDSKYLNASNRCGPTLLPISKRSIDLIDEELKNSVGEDNLGNVSFVGAMYPYRKKLINKLKNLGLDIVVNPHVASNSKSEKNNASYVDYVKALRKGKMALNLSRANGVNVSQLKSRVLESPVFGVPVLSDERDLTSIFFECDSEFIHFNAQESSIKEISKLVNNKLVMDNISSASQKKARAIAQSCFWNVTRSACLKVNSDA